MGDWTTLHLFDEAKFIENTIPILKGSQEEKLRSYYLEYLKYNEIGGLSRFSDAEIMQKVNFRVAEMLKLTTPLNNDFTKHALIQNMNDAEELHVFSTSNEFHYDFAQFFSFLMFQTCAAYQPQLGLGKHGIRNRFDFKWNSVARHILNDLDVGNYNSFFTNDGMGVTSWIGNEAVRILMLDCQPLQNSEDEIDRAFYTFLETAMEGNLGLLIAVNLLEDKLGDSVFSLK